jgi:hypothetical protein
MKSLVFNFIGILLLLLFAQCGGSKKVSYELQKEAHFEVLKATYKNWIGGLEGARGTTFEIVINDLNVVIDTVYFRDKKTTPNVKKIAETSVQITGNIKNKLKPVLILHKNREQEFGNIGPTKDIHFPFVLLKSELVLSYYQNNKIEYLKIELLKEKIQFFK